MPGKERHYAWAHSAERNVEMMLRVVQAGMGQEV